MSKFQFWTLNLNSTGLRAAKIFLLDQISLVMNGSTPTRSSENCPNAHVMASVFSYDESNDNYFASGKTELLKATSLLHLNVSKFILSQNSGRINFKVRKSLI